VSRHSQGTRAAAVAASLHRHAGPAASPSPCTAFGARLPAAVTWSRRGVTFGNELDGVRGLEARLDLHTYVRGLARLSAMLARLWPDTRSRPLLAAPDSNFDSSWFEALLRNAPFLQALSQHVYSGPGDMDSFPLRALSTSWLAKHVKSAMRMVESIHRVPQSRASPWVTEFASTYASGAPGSDTFASSLWYADALGSMAQSGYRMACRQTLVGGHYSLTRWGPGGALQPNPDFFVALLWRRLMGARVLQVRGSFWVERLRGHVHSARECAHYSSLVGHPQCKHLIRKGMLALPLPQWVRAYAHCTYSGPPGSVAITLINLNLSHASRRTYAAQPACAEACLGHSPLAPQPARAAVYCTACAAAHQCLAFRETSAYVLCSRPLLSRCFASESRVRLLPRPCSAQSRGCQSAGRDFAAQGRAGREVAARPPARVAESAVQPPHALIPLARARVARGGVAAGRREPADSAASVAASPARVLLSTA